MRALRSQISTNAPVSSSATEVYRFLLPQPTEQPDPNSAILTSNAFLKAALSSRQPD
ncbi:MAG: hypothetical protein MZV70_44885 [Desulfobacterales bacterium]|nr:hypothetical protein [Desulfobacterales bacterium]